MTTDRYARGVELMEAVQGPQAATDIRDSFDRLSPDFGRYVVEAGFADIYGREGLDLPQRQLLNIGVLTAIGGAEPQLETHLRGALNVGVTPTEIVEAIIHVALYAGHPRTVNGLNVARKVFAEQGISMPSVSDE